MCGGGGSKSQTVYQAQLPGPLTDRMAMTADAAIALSDDPFEAYTGPRVAGLTGMQQSAMQTAGALQGYQAPNAHAVQAQTRDATATTGQAVNAQGTRINAPGGWSIEGKDLSGYTNPWDTEVIRTSMSDIDRELARAQEAAAGSAAMSGAWGGSAAALQQSGLAGDALRTKASTIAGLRQAGYARAQDLASADITRGIGLGQAQAALDQETALTNAGAQNQFGLANMQARNQFALANKGATDQFSLANMEAWNTANLADQQASLAAAGIRANAGQQAWGMGAAEQATQQAQMDVDYDEFLRRINDPFQKTQFAIGALTGVSPNFATSTSTTRTPTGSSAATIAGLGTMAAGLASFAHGGTVAGLADPVGYWGGGGVQAQAPRAARPAPPPAADVPADPALAELLAALAVQDAENGIDPGVAAPRIAPGAGLGAAPQAASAAPPPAAPVAGLGAVEAPAEAPPVVVSAPSYPAPSALPPGQVRAGLSLEDQEAPDAAVARQAGLPVNDRGQPQVAGLSLPPPRPMTMPSPAAFSAPDPQGRTYSSDDPVIRARYELESGGNPRAMNERTGAVGLGQYRPDRLIDLGVYTPSRGERWTDANGRATRATWAGTFNIPGFEGVRTVADLRANPEAQAEIERRNAIWERRQIQALGLDRYIGQRVAGMEVTEADLRHAIHFAGATGAARFFETGGRYNPTDGNLRVNEYIARMRAGGGRDGGGGGGAPRYQSVAHRPAAAPAPGLPQDDGRSAAPAAGVEGQATGGAGAEDVARPGWFSRVRAGFRDPSGEGAALPMGLLAAGLGMLASRSTNPLQAVGEGGLMGVQFVNQARQSRAIEARNAATAQHQSRMADAAERRLGIQATTAARTAAAAERAAALAEQREGRAERAEGRATAAAERAAERAGLEPGMEWDPARPGAVRPIPGSNRDPVNRPRARTLTEEEAVARGFQPGSVVTEDVDPRSGEVVGPPVVRQNPRPPRQHRALAANQGEDLVKQAGRVATLDRLSRGFRDDYGGQPFVGNAANWAGRNLPLGQGLEDQGQWWQDYQLFANEVRHSLFGAALTAPELAQFERATITPGMTPSAIRRNLARQQEIARVAAERTGAMLLADGYNPEAVATGLNIPIERLEAARIRRASGQDAIPTEEDEVPAASGARPRAGNSLRTSGTGRPAANDTGEPVRVETEADVRRLAPGTRFRGPDGVVRIVPERRASGG